MQRLEPEGMTAAIGPDFLDRVAEKAVTAAGMASAPRIFPLMPQAAKRKLVEQSRELTPEIMRGVLSDLKAEAAVFLNLEQMALRIFRPQRRLVIAMFINGGFNEICFVRNAGAVIGMTFGMVQLAIYTCYRADWVLPAFGGCIGAFTNWLALQLIFRPIYPVNCGCCVMQGLFLKRQKQVSAIFARGLKATTSNAKQVIIETTRESGAARFREISLKRAYEAIDAMAMEQRGCRWVLGSRLMRGLSNSQSLRRLSNAIAGTPSSPRSPAVLGGVARPPLVSEGRSTSELTEVSLSELSDGGPELSPTEAADMWAVGREAAANVIADAMVPCMERCEDYIDEALDLEATIREIAASLDPKYFEELFHATFESDEWKLFAVGGTLGLLIGFGQNYLLQQ